MTDLYHVLGVDRGASAKQIKTAYRKLAHELHPDKNPDDKKAEEKFKEVTHAYDTLSNEKKRRHYDRFGRYTQSSGPSAQNIGDVFSEIFGDFFSAKRGKSTKQRGRDRSQSLRIDFEIAAQGGYRELKVEQHSSCGTCNGTGAKPGSTPQICHACGGSGEIHVQQGLFSVSKKCTYCKARGRIIPKPCKSCKGDGQTSAESNLRVSIPAGAKEGMVLRFAGKGEIGEHGGPNGDLRITLEILPHAYFEREGSDLLCELPITMVEAALGAQVEVPTLAGRVRMKIPPGTQTGGIFRLRGKGLSDLKGGRGDQRVKIVVEVPQNLSAEDKSLLEKLKSLEGAKHYPSREEFWEKAK